MKAAAATIAAMMAVIVATGISSGNHGSMIVMLTVAAIVGWWSWPGRRGRHVPHREAATIAGPDGVIVYWRPGCTFCLRLRLGLGRRAGDVTWVNIWADPAAAAFVATQREGNQTVPTVTTGDGRQLPPTASAVRSQLDGRVDLQRR